MSRLTSMSPEAIKQMFSPDSDADLITLLTFYENNGTTVLARLANSYTKRISETADEVLYGVTSRGLDYTFLPFEITLPSEEEANAPRCSVVMHDVTRYLTPIIRTITKPVEVKIELVLNKSPDTVEILLEDFEIRNFVYTAEQVTAELTMVSLDREPFPMYSYTPQFNPGMF